jgi:predicted GIY-YIG superfamily endonuclease
MKRERTIKAMSRLAKKRLIEHKVEGEENTRIIVP